LTYRRRGRGKKKRVDTVTDTGGRKTIGGRSACSPSYEALVQGEKIQEKKRKKGGNKN